MPVASVEVSTPALEVADSSIPWRVPALLGGLSLLSTLDEPARRWVQDSRSDSLDDFADWVGPFGHPRVYLSVGGGVLVAGALLRDREVFGSGARIAGSLATAGVLARGGKYLFGRARPSRRLGAHDFDAFSNRTSLPSGHSTMAFALATSLSHEIDRRWASVTLYSLATATAWSRMEVDLHWLSDVAAGAVLGYYSARVVQGLFAPGSRGFASTVMVLPSASGLQLCLQRPF